MNLKPLVDSKAPAAEPSKVANGGRRPDVLIVLHDLRGGGAERAMLRLAIGMASAGASVELLLIQRRGDYLHEVPSSIQLTSLDTKSVAAALAPLARYIRRRNPRSILSALTHVNLVVIASAKLARFAGNVIVSERNHISSKAGAAKGLRDKLTYQLVPYLYPLATKVAAVSSGVADNLISRMRLSPKRVTFVHNPVFDETLLSRAAQEPSHPWLVSKTKPVIVAFGRLHPQKDFRMLIAAFAQVRSHADARLIIFGEGSERAELEAIVAQTGVAPDISLPGFTSEPLAEMSHADVLALSSRFEGFPNVLVEGLACGLPVVATDCPSGPEEILDGGKYGALVPVGNVQKMADALLGALSNPNAGVGSRERAATFSVNAAVGRYLGLLGINEQPEPA